MIRHPILRAAQASAALASAALCALHALAAAQAPTATSFSLSVLGERERPDGSWQGADLLRDADQPVDRFQLSLTPDQDVRVVLEAQVPGGPTERLFPAFGKDGVLARGRAYALPDPRSFYGLEGRARLRLVVTRVHAGGAAVELTRPATLAPGPPQPLTDGTRFPLTTAALHAQTGAALEFELHQ